MKYISKIGMKFSKTWAAAAAMVALSGAAQAALIDNGGGLIYDNVRNITWLADMNYAYTSGYTGAGVNSDGKMTWDFAKSWADNLEYRGLSNWRLPTLNPSDTTCNQQYQTLYYGSGCTGGELSGLFITDLGKNTSSDTQTQIDNLALFTNVKADAYWSGTERTDLSAYAWYLDGVISQESTFKTTRYYAVAVHDGNVSAVPVPGSLGLLGVGLAALGFVRRRRAS
jgi:hypothetical protein